MREKVVNLAGVVSRIDNPPDISSDDGKHHFLLLDGDLDDDLQDHVMNLHFPASRRWVLEGTAFDNEKEHGTLLQEMDDEGIFLKQYTEQWSTDHLGILIETRANIDVLQQHLKNTIEADTPDSKDLFFRWHEPRKLAGLLNTLNNQQISNLLGPIGTLCWCEIAHDEAHWYTFENRHTDSQPAQPRLMINKDQVEQLNDYDLYYYARTLSRQLLEAGKRPETISEEHFARAVLKNIKDALALNITEDDDINHYIDIQLEHSNTLAENASIRAIFRDETLLPWQRLKNIQQALENPDKGLKGV